MRDRTWRREWASRKASYRMTFWENRWRYLGMSEEERQVFLGKSRKNHSGCGCILCKPWKHGYYIAKPSDRRRLAAATTGIEE